MAHRRAATIPSTRKPSLRNTVNGHSRRELNTVRRSLPSPEDSDIYETNESDDQSITPKRTVLAPVHPNLRLRKLPGRMFQAVKNSVKTAIGGKRKRVGENSRTVSGRAKRRRREPEPSEESESESVVDASEMEVDDAPRWRSGDEDNESCE